MDFNQIIDRHHTGSVKWELARQHAGQDAQLLLPMWVSDFDFACPPAVQAALSARAAHGVFGYTERQPDYFAALLNWANTRHGLTLNKEWICSVEGVVPGIALLLQMLSAPGDNIVVQGPYYGTFRKIITLNDRLLLENPLREVPGEGYQLDFDHLEALFRDHRPPLMILCNPHNPTGRCWTSQELERILTLCEAYNVMVIADEIWADLILPGATFTSVLHLGERWHSRLIVATSASKSFGLSSLRISNFLIPEPGLRERFQKRLNAHGMDAFNAMALTAATTAWQEGAPWLDELLAYLADNRAWFTAQAKALLPWAIITPAQATYLLWLDCRALGLDDAALQEAMEKKAGVIPSMGVGFGPQGSGFVRLNLGCPRHYLEQALEGLMRI
ncbi:MAG: MalY/PatB family protein [Scandinavium sp.]|uniref:MalY/PatB family protein n=1 Tax=Scandinavium sp. TaxID=2830653 RepID=UPI003F3A7DA6